MNIAIWVVTIALAAMFLMAGVMKSTQPKEKLKASGMAWVDDFSANTIKFIGIAEVLGAIGLILPAVTDVAPILVAWAAVGLAITQVGAIIVHARRGENDKLPMNAVLLAGAVFVAIMRFGPNAF